MKRRMFRSADVKGASTKYHRFNKEYRTWRRAISKCTNPNHHNYYNYGGRGLEVDPLFRYSFLNFINEIGECPEPKLEYSIERINNDIGYMSGNIKWIKTIEQAINRSNSILVNMDGVEMTLLAACEKTGVSPTTVYTRIRRGIPIDEAFEVERQRHNPLIIFNQGKPIRLYAFAKKYGLRVDTVYRLHRKGLTGDDILICPEVYKHSTGRGIMLEYNGLSMSRAAWAKYLGINNTTIIDKLNKGYSIGFICDMYLGRGGRD